MKTTLKAKWSLYCALAGLMGEARCFFKPVLIGWLLIAAIEAQAAMYYVGPSGSDANNGTSWALAKRTIQAGINVAVSGDTILVADGTYGPITITPGITVRSVNGAQATIINGGGLTHCAYLNTNAVLDGFIVTNGYARYEWEYFVNPRVCGGGVYNDGGTVQNCTISGNSATFAGGVFVNNGMVQNCIISGNMATAYGGGVNLYCGSMVQNCTISENTGGYGTGGVNVHESTIQNCTISGNSAACGCYFPSYDWWPYSGAGGIYNYGGTVQDCTISENRAFYEGGGVYSVNGTIQNCMFNGNAGHIVGGGVSVWGGTVENCTFSENTAADSGGGVSVWGGTIQNCTVRGNSANYGGGVIALYGGIVQNCMIGGNMATACGGGVYAIYGGSMIQNCTIIGNTGGAGGGVEVDESTVRNCTVSGNTATDGGGVRVGCGGMMENCTISGNMANDGGGVQKVYGTVQNCTISGNSANYGGGISVWSETMRNCVISGNIAHEGGGVSIWSGTMENCTISGNKALYSGGVHAPGGMVQNCIAYYNQNGDVIGPAPISYSCIGTTIAGVGNITNEPQFVSTGIGYGTNHVPGNYRLRTTSPCINAGTNQSWMTNAVDLDGLPRILGGVVDMGSYECLGTNSIIMRNPTILSNRCDYGTNAIGQTIEVWNVGTGAMAYVLSPNENWLALSPTSGTSTGETDFVSVNYASAGLAPGSYTSIVTITSAEAINSPQVVTVYLWVNNPEPGTVQFRPSSYSVDENVGIVMLTVIRAGSSFGPASVDYATADGSALAGSDYTSRSGTLTWSDGDTSSKTITVSITDDSIDENNETFTVTLSNVVGAGLGLPGSATVTILDNDDPPAGVIQFAETSKEVGEGDGAITLSVVRTGGGFGPVSVDYAMANGTALAGSDYTSKSGTLSWPDGDTSSKTITVSITDDSIDENNETFTVTLRNAVGAGLGSLSLATVTIVDNDEPPANTADIEVADLKFEPGNLWAGDHPAMISFDLVNDGPADLVAPDAQLEIVFSLSSNTTFGDEDDIAIGTATEGITLTAGSQTTIRNPGRAHNSDVTIPAGLSGDYYVFVSVRLVSQSGLSDPDGACAMRDGPIRVRIHPAANDYDGDGKSDVAVYQEDSGYWHIVLSASGEVFYEKFGAWGYRPAPGDYDGDGKTDVAVYQESSGSWYVMLPDSGYAIASAIFGGMGYTPVPRDFDGDGKTDPALYQETTGDWYVMLSAGEYGMASVNFGGPGYSPVPGDYDEDGKLDPGLYQESSGNWYMMFSASGYGLASVNFGGPGYSPVPGDYDGDGKADLGVYQESSGNWYISLSESGTIYHQKLGGIGYEPVPGDYDGDGKTDLVVYHEASGNWDILFSPEGMKNSLQFGGSGYVPVGVFR